MGKRDLEQRESLADPLWRQYERTLLNKIAYRDKELLELHEDYVVLEMRLNGLWSIILRQAKRDRAERELEAANRRLARAANE